MNAEKERKTRKFEILLGAILILVVLGGFALSTYGIKRSYSAKAVPLSFRYPVLWYVEEGADKNATYINACDHDEPATGSKCLQGVGIAVFPSLSAWLAYSSVPAVASEGTAAVTFHSVDEYISHNRFEDFGTRNLAGYQARVYDSSTEEGNGHILEYDVTVDGRFYEISAPYASSPDTLTHGQQVVIDSLQL